MTTTEVHSRTSLLATVFEILGSIAPEADLDELDPDAPMQEALDIDSFDFLQLLIGLDEAVGVEIPEADYGQLRSLNNLLDYLEAHI